MHHFYSSRACLFKHIFSYMNTLVKGHSDLTCSLNKVLIESATWLISFTENITITRTPLGFLKNHRYWDETTNMSTMTDCFVLLMLSFHFFSLSQSLPFLRLRDLVWPQVVGHSMGQGSVPLPRMDGLSSVLCRLQRPVVKMSRPFFSMSVLGIFIFLT